MDKTAVAEILSMSEADLLYRELDRIELYRQRGCATWDDEQRAQKLKRRLADLEFTKRSTR